MAEIEFADLKNGGVLTGLSRQHAGANMSIRVVVVRDRPRVVSVIGGFGVTPEETRAVADAVALIEGSESSDAAFRQALGLLEQHFDLYLRRDAGGPFRK